METINKNHLTNSFFLFLIPLFLNRGLRKELRHLAKYEYFLFLISNRQEEPERYVEISNGLLRKVIRQKMITRIKKNLFELGVIECDFKKKFIISKGKTIGKKSYAYRISKEYYVPINSKNETYINRDGFDTNPDSQSNILIMGLYNRDAFMDKLNKSRISLYEKIVKAHRTRWDDLVCLENSPEYSFIQNNTNKLSIDSSGYNWIDGEVIKKRPLKASRCEFINERGELVVYLNKKRTLNEEIGEEWKNYLKKIELKQFQFSCPASVNRVFYNITSIPSELRKFFRYNGQVLAYLDFSNFQPFLLIKFLKDKFGEHLPEDVLIYIHLTSEGLFYSDIQKKIEDNGILIRDKSSFKIDFFGRVFFSSERRKYKFRVVFDKYFPNVSKVITELKRNNYKDLAILLQRLESKIVINSIIKEIAIKYPESFVLPVHDAIICEESMKDVIKVLMLEKVQEIIGCRPNVKEEKLVINH
jgi:hypothetical protein